VLYGNVAFSEASYMLLLEWHYDTITHTFLLTEHGNRSLTNNSVLITTHSISSIEDLESVCHYLNTLGYQITDIRLMIECASHYGWTTSCFKHIIDLAWFGKSFLLEDEYVKFSDYTINYDYQNNTSSITTFDDKKLNTYNFDYILNISLKNYKVLKTKIKQILLLG